ncbi:peptidyl-prolyl cis-trans isomerase B (cyclophilin B) [Chitinophaga niastensis]|uniref:Peptidyl-prolyl cis-trans isomerase n=1 Tax=Chitinophaga niastensis TaxID=536980 RepID=A0A2P8HTW0_CHINA|nr:peptidylprolyl isomerase [Chitinophaga niastensis]PSL49642.1 peptidyl-prolyl cis-trans isomerase B (cyclophilin B) [Chitinophaga niastensis]
MKKLLLLSTLLLSIVFFASARDRRVKVITPYGTMIIRLYDQTPKHRDNFIKLARQHFYDSTLFHRVIKSFMIQGGDPDSKHAHPGDTLGNGDLGYTIPPEFQLDLYHRKGALGAAREDRPDKASSSCQFYIVQGKVLTDEQLDKIEKTRLGGRKIPVDQREVYKTAGGSPHLDQSYTVFGQVIKGMDVIDKIAALQTDSHDRPLQDVPVQIRVMKKWFFF